MLSLQNVSFAGVVVNIGPQSTVHSIYIPEEYGTIDGQIRIIPQVILIKDAHCHYEAQRNIAKILDILIKDYKVDLVCMEGASGPVDTSVFQSMPDKRAREAATDKFVKKGYLTASEALSISKANELPFTIWGVEDTRLYIEDLKKHFDLLVRAMKLEEKIDYKKVEVERAEKTGG